MNALLKKDYKPGVNIKKTYAYFNPEKVVEQISSDISEKPTKDKLKVFTRIISGLSNKMTEMLNQME